MELGSVKIYGICLERLKHQIDIAKSRISKGLIQDNRVILESYNTDDIDEIIDILELYDIEHRTNQALKEKLDELSYTVSLLIRHIVEFDYDEDGNLGIYLNLQKECK